MPTPNKLTEADKKLALALFAEGIPRYKIAAHLGVAPNAINRLVNLQKKAAEQSGK